MEDFRPPEAMRRGRQNIQKQVNNPFMQFLRWSCKKLLDSQNHSVLAFVVPLSFLEAESYKYARKFLCEHFSEVWAVAVDADARTGVRSDSLFHTLQGRAVIVLTRKYGDNTPITKVHFCDYSHSTHGTKERLLNDEISIIVSRFEEYEIDKDTLAFSPIKPFNTEMYKKFWPVSDENGQNAIFLNHCSGIKLAPTAIFTHVKAPMLKRRSREIASHEANEAMTWFVQQDRPPKEEKVIAFQKALNDCGDRRAMDQMLTDNIHPYSFRPFLTSNVLLWQELLTKYSRIGGGGTRLRPEIIKAYSDPNTIGFAMAHAPKDLNPTLSQFVSFCWYYPDNDMCTRGNSHIYMNQYPDGQRAMSSNISSEIMNVIISMTGMSEEMAARDIVFYVYAVMCSQVYLDAFEGALFTVNQSDKRARIPIVADKDAFLSIAEMGKIIAGLEKKEYTPQNILGFEYDSLMESVPEGFQLKNSIHPFDAENELLLLTDGNRTIEIYCPLSLQRLNISGYDVIKAVWLKFNSYNFTHCEFTRDDMKRLLDFLNTIATHEKYVEKLDEIIAPILSGEVPLVENKH
jgi:predicted helicase